MSLSFPKIQKLLLIQFLQLLKDIEYPTERQVFIKGDYESKSDFCTLNHVDINDLENLIEYSKKYDKDTYNQYQTIIAEQRSNRFNKILELVKQLIYYLENGIEDEFGVVRPFDIIDYHLYIGISYEMLRKIIHDNLC